MDRVIKERGMTNADQDRNRNDAMMVTAQQKEIERLKIDRDAWRLTAKTFSRAYDIK
jgi:hypothetical protein